MLSLRERARKTNNERQENSASPAAAGEALSFPPFALLAHFAHFAHRSDSNFDFRDFSEKPLTKQQKYVIIIQSPV